MSAMFEDGDTSLTSLLGSVGLDTVDSKTWNKLGNDKLRTPVIMTCVKNNFERQLSCI